MVQTVLLSDLEPIKTTNTQDSGNKWITEIHTYVCHELIATLTGFMHTDLIWFLILHAMQQKSSYCAKQSNHKQEKSDHK